MSYEKVKEKRLIKVVEELRKYCHSDDCDSPYECPKYHEKCRENLSLDTAIAWIACNDIESCLNGRISIDAVLNPLSVVIDVLLLHIDDYQKLFDLITQAYVVLNHERLKVR